MYVVNSPNIVRAVERQPKTISFWYVEAKATSRIGGMSKEANKKLLENLQGVHGKESLLLKGLDETHKVMKPGNGITPMVSIAAQTAAGHMEELETNSSSRRIDLWEWVRHEITVATTEAVYGPTNPYRDTDVEHAFW